MTIWRSFLSVWIAVAVGLFPLRAHGQLQAVGDGGPGPVKAQHLTAELMSVSPEVAPGGTVETGLVLTLEDKWHVYWKNAGDSGEPPKITWTLPKGVTAEAMRFPIPSRLPLGPLMDFGYEDKATFPVEIAVAKDVKPGPIHLDAKVSWLVCREVCIPGKAHLGLDLKVVPGASQARDPVGAVGEALKLLPRPLPEYAHLTVHGGRSDIVFTLITGDREDGRRVLSAGSGPDCKRGRPGPGVAAGRIAAAGEAGGGPGSSGEVGAPAEADPGRAEAGR